MHDPDNELRYGFNLKNTVLRARHRKVFEASNLLAEERIFLRKKKSFVEKFTIFGNNFFGVPFKANITQSVFACGSWSSGLRRSLQSLIPAGLSLSVIFTSDQRCRY